MQKKEQNLSNIAGVEKKVSNYISETEELKLEDSKLQSELKEMIEKTDELRDTILKQ